MEQKRTPAVPHLYRVEQARNIKSSFRLLSCNNEHAVHGIHKKRIRRPTPIELGQLELVEINFRGSRYKINTRLMEHKKDNFGALYLIAYCF